MRMVPTSLLVGLALGCGALGGAALDDWLSLRQYRFDWQRRAQRALSYHPSKVDPKQWVVDSAAEARSRRDFEARWPPREIGREQAFMHCVVAFEVRDTMYKHVQLFEAQAWDRGQTGKPISRGYTFEPNGFRRGDVVHVVFPNVWCRDLVIGGYGGGAMVGSTQPPPQLDVR